MKRKHYPADEEFLARLKENMNDPRAEQLPERLRPENISALLDAAAPAEKKVIAFPVRRVAAMAAAFVLIVAAALLLPKASDRMFDVNLLNSDAATVDGYGHVEAVFRTLYEERKTEAGTGYLTDGAVKNTEIAEAIPMPETPVAAEDVRIEETSSYANAAQESVELRDDEGGAHSSTNVQVAGIDEADYVKTDGKNLYVLTNRGGDWVIQNGEKRFAGPQLQIISADNGDMEPLWSYEPEGARIDELFLSNGKLVVMMTPVDEYGREYYSDDDYSLFSTVAEVYDVSDATSPELLRTFSQEGSYHDSRIINGKLLLVSRKFTALKGEQFEFVPEEIIPKVCDRTCGIDDQPVLLPADSVYCMPNVNTTVFTVVSMVDLESQQPAQSMTVLGDGILYANYENIYLANTVYNGATYYRWSSDAPDWSVSTDLARISIADGKPTLAATGSVKGTLCSQFAMDEYDGYLRVATNSEEYSEETGYLKQNNFYVLDMDLKPVGTLEGLAPGENMYSVRFEGETVYAVTFRTVDPFFVIDLSDPTKPTVTGELKIPGFSQYLHPYSDTLVIGFGMDTVESADGSTAYYQGFKVAMFDVSDPQNPVEKHTLYIGDRGSSSDILYDHKALLYDKEKNIIGIPISITKLKEYGAIWDYGGLVFEGYIVLGYDEENGFYEKGRVAHEGKYNVERVLRGMYIGNVLYTVSDLVVVSTDLETFEQIDRLAFYVESDPASAPIVYAQSSEPVIASSTVSKIYE